MEQLRIKAGNMELRVTGKQDAIMSASKDFYDFITTKNKQEIEAKMEFAEKMRAKMSWSAKEHDEGHRAEHQEPPASESGNATLRTENASLTSWEKLAEEIKSGSASMKVGDRVDFELKSGEAVTVVVTDVNDEYVRFESEDCVGDEVCWNKSGSKEHGIVTSDVLDYLNSEVYEMLPDDLKRAVSTVVRKRKDDDGDILEYRTVLFLPAASEVFDEDSCYGDEGVYEQLEYYKDRRHRMKGAGKGKDTESWWLATASSGNSAVACDVGGYGYAYHDNASFAYRVPLCFCINKSK